MQIDEKKLREKITERGLTLSEFSQYLGINPATLYRKLGNEGETFTVGQMHKSAEILSLSKSECVDIFLPSYSQ